MKEIRIFIPPDDDEGLYSHSAVEGLHARVRKMIAENFTSVMNADYSDRITINFRDIASDKIVKLMLFLHGYKLHHEVVSFHPGAQFISTKPPFRGMGVEVLEILKNECRVKITNDPGDPEGGAIGWETTIPFRYLRRPVEKLQFAPVAISDKDVMAEGFKDKWVPGWTPDTVPAPASRPTPPAVPGIDDGIC